METKIQQQAICPKCEKELDYNGNMQHSDQNIGYEWTCSECGIAGTEWYYLKFCEHIVNKE